MGYLNNAGLGRFYEGIKSRFLQKTAAVNNLTTTAAGAVLDARQGKALKDGLTGMETALAGKATTLTLTATLSTAWTGSGPYTQTVPVNGLLATDNPVVDVALSDAAATAQEQLEAWTCVGRIVTAANELTVICYEDVPAVALPIRLKVVR